MVHAESDGLPSLIVDRYGDHVVAQLLSAGLEAVRGQATDHPEVLTMPESG